MFCYLPYFAVSNLDVPEDGNDVVDSDEFWDNVGFALVVRGFFHSGLDKNAYLNFTCWKTSLLPDIPFENI